MYPPAIQKLINLLSKLPSVGPRTAARFVFYFLELDKKETEELTAAISNLKEKVKLCKLCYKSFELSEEKKEFCEICKNPKRDRSLICLTEKEADLISIEKTKKYQGLYFILGGQVSFLKKKKAGKSSPLDSGKSSLVGLRAKEFLKRAKEPEIKEIIIALNPTTEGEATALYLERLLEKNLPALPAGQGNGKKITRLGRGLPIGGELEYADPETLSSALESRR